MPVANNGKRKRAKNAMTPSTGPPPAKQRMVVTPWRDIKEFSTVYDWLFSKQTTPGNRRKALSQIMIWRLRRGSLCPAAVIASGVMIRAQLDDKLGDPNVQMKYASAFTRFFNFMSSTMQSHSMSSMYETARKLGLQSFIVDLRHLCAHGQELPPVYVLRTTAEHCVEWLRKFYWLPQYETMKNLDAKKLQRKDKAKVEKELNSLFEIYDLALECQLKGAQKLKNISKLKTSAVFNKMRTYCSARKLKTAKEMTDSVISELGAAVKRHKSIMKDLVDIYIAGILKMNYFLSAGLVHNEEEELVIEATQDLFRLLAKQGYIDNMFEAFVQLTENANADVESRSGASYWAAKMLETFGMLNRMKRMYSEELDKNLQCKVVDFSTLNKPQISKTLRSLLIHSGVDRSLTLIFGECPKNPRSWVFEPEFLMNRMASLNIFSTPVLEGLLPLVEPPLSAEQKGDILEQCNVKHAVMMETSTIVNDEPESTEFGIWKLDTDPSWSKCALGVLPPKHTVVEEQ